MRPKFHNHRFREFWSSLLRRGRRNMKSFHPKAGKFVGVERVIDDALKSRHDARRTTEVAIAVKSLNRMNELGRAKFVRIA